MPALVRYAPRAMRMAAFSNPYARAGMYAYRYGPTAARAAGRIARWGVKRMMARRGRKRKKSYHPANAKKRIGKPVGTGNAKSTLIENTGLVGKNTRTLYSGELINIPKSDSINHRVRNIINVRGFKFCMQVHNLLDRPLNLNVAIISPKNANTIVTNEFFRDQGGAQRSTNFVDARTSLEFKCLPINTDMYNILRHKRYVLAPSSSGEGDPMEWKCDRKCTYLSLEWYTKVKRQFQFDNVTDTEPDSNQVFLVYWADGWGTAGGTATVLNAFEMMERHIMYYKEPCC